MMFEAMSRMMRNCILNQFQIRPGATKVSCSVVSDNLCWQEKKIIKLRKISDSPGSVAAFCPENILIC